MSYGLRHTFLGRCSLPVSTLGMERVMAVLPLARVYFKFWVQDNGKEDLCCVDGPTFLNDFAALNCIRSATETELLSAPLDWAMDALYVLAVYDANQKVVMKS